jgi:hypothetical protein
MYIVKIHDVSIVIKHAAPWDSYNKKAALGRWDPGRPGEAKGREDSPLRL